MCLAESFTILVCWRRFRAGATKRNTWKLPDSTGTSLIWSGYLFSHLSTLSSTNRSPKMSEAAHPEPNYMGVFLWLVILTVLELAVVYMPFTKMIIAVLLISLAVSKAALV